MVERGVLLLVIALASTAAARPSPLTEQSSYPGARSTLRRLLCTELRCRLLLGVALALGAHRAAPKGLRRLRVVVERQRRRTAGH